MPPKRGLTIRRPPSPQQNAASAGSARSGSGSRRSRSRSRNRASPVAASRSPVAAARSPVAASRSRSRSINRAARYSRRRGAPKAAGPKRSRFSRSQGKRVSNRRATQIRSRREPNMRRMKAVFKAAEEAEAQQLAAAHARHAYWQGRDAAALRAREVEEAARSEPFHADRMAFNAELQRRYRELLYAREAAARRGLVWREL